MTVPTTTRTNADDQVSRPFVKSWRPTNKWLAGLVSAVAGLLVNWITAGELTKEIKIAAVSVATTAVLSYLVPNNGHPGGYTPR